MRKQPIRLAIVGGNRGSRFYDLLASLADRISLAAICDLNDQILHHWKEQYPWISTYQSYEQLLQNPDIDAVFLASPMLLHARQSIDALKAGKHVLSEVIAAHTVDEAWELVETVEQTGLVYMMAENYCFSRANLMIRHMAEQGLFGEITYMEGGYIHDLRAIVHQPNGSLNWRGQLHHAFNGMNYPTHSLGPLAQWIAVNKPGGDRLDTMSTYVSNTRALRQYFHEQFGGDHPAAQEGYWKQGDCAVTAIRTRKGVLMTLRVDWTSVRPHNMRHYALQGTEGAYLSARHEHEDDLIWLRGRSPVLADGTDTWEPLERFRAEHDHPQWKRWEHHASLSGHGGGDFMVIEEFTSAIKEQRSPAIDVYDAVTWSSLFPLSMESVASGGKPVAIPDFYGKRDRQKEIGRL
ncbi:Gfo/Idh/MocA family protein [Paenibacillus vandeheii]